MSLDGQALAKSTLPEVRKITLLTRLQLRLQESDDDKIVFFVRH